MLRPCLLRCDKTQQACSSLCHKYVLTLQFLSKMATPAVGAELVAPKPPQIRCAISRGLTVIKVGAPLTNLGPLNPFLWSVCVGGTCFMSKFTNLLIWELALFALFFCFFLQLTRNQARDQTHVSKEPAVLDFEPAGLELKPVGPELEPVGLEFGPKLAWPDPNWSPNRPPGMGKWPGESSGVTRGRLGPKNWN